MKNATSERTAIVAAGASAITISVLYLLHRRRERVAASISQGLPPISAAKTGTVSHVRVRSADPVRSIRFYHDLGFVDASTNSVPTAAAAAAFAVLKSPSPHPGQPFLVIEEDPSRKQRTANAAAAGYARMCFLVKDVQSEVERMKNIGHEPVAPAVTDRPGSAPAAGGKNPNPPVTIVAYRDPDGNMVELVSMTGVASAALSVFRALGLLRFPAWVHVNVNATSYDKSYDAYSKIGFQTDIDYGRVVNNLYKSLMIPDPGIARQVALIKIPGTNFSVDLIEWEDPRTTATAADGELGSSLDMAVAVPDVAIAIDELVNGDGGGWSLVSKPRIIDLPLPLGKMISASIADPDGVETSLVSYPTNLFYEGKKSRPKSSVTPSADKVVLVTGCDTGFGRSVSMQLAGLGFTVVAACYTVAGQNFLAGVAQTVVADLSTEKGVNKVVEATTSACSSAELWGIVNNAGMCHPGHVEWTEPAAYKQVMALNFFAPVTIIHELIPLIKKSKGRIVNVTSVCGLVSSPSNSTYSASKFAMEALSDALRVEVKPFGVDVVVLEPTTMRTPLGMGWADLWKKNFDAADSLRTSQYSQAWADGLYNFSSNHLKTAGEDPMITVKAIVDSLVMPVQKARVLCGEGAKGYRFLSMLPDKWRDSILQEHFTWKS